MKIFYITNVIIPAVNAQSVQIKSMLQAFNSTKNVSAVLFAPTNIKYNNHIPEIGWIKVRTIFRKRLLRYVEVLIRSTYHYLKIKPDIVYTRDIGIAILYIFTGKTVVYELHSVPKNDALKILKLFNNFKIVTISMALSDYIVRKYCVKNITYYHDGVFLNDYIDIEKKYSKVDLREQLNLPQDKIIILHSGSLYINRGIEYFETILQEFPEILFIQVGGNLKDINYWKEYYSKYSNIIFVKHQDRFNLVKYQLAANIMFYVISPKTSSYWYCSPMKVFEYMASGNPILCTSIGSVSEILNEDNSYIYSLDDKNTIASQLKLILEDFNSALTKAKAARDLIKEKYTWEKRAESIIKHLNEDAQ